MAYISVLKFLQVSVKSITHFKIVIALYKSVLFSNHYHSVDSIGSAYTQSQLIQYDQFDLARTQYNWVRGSGYIRDMFHVYLNRSEFDFLWLHIIKTHKFGFVMHNERVPGKTK